MTQPSTHILRDGPFLGTGEPAAGNISLLALLSPIWLTAPFIFRGEDWQGLAPPWGWLAALVGGFLGVLLCAPDRRAALARLDWAAVAMLAGVILFFPGPVGSILGGMLFDPSGEYQWLDFAPAVSAGFLCGCLSARPETARWLGSPGLLPLLALGATLTALYLGTRDQILYHMTGSAALFRWYMYYPPHLGALAVAGFCFATGRCSVLYWAFPWVAAIMVFLLAPFPMRPPFDRVEMAQRIAVFILPVFFIAPQLARSKAELAVYEFLALIFFLFSSQLESQRPMRSTSIWFPGPEPTVFGLVLLYWPIHRWFSKKTRARYSGQPAEPILQLGDPITLQGPAAKAVIKCGGRGTAPRLADWQGLASFRLAAAHDGGPLLCPYGCVGLGDCARVCPAKAISLGADAFPVVNAAACRGCGLCAEVCPKGLIELLGEARALIPCRAQSSLKKNAAYCDRSCLGCGRCRKACPAGALSREGASGAMAVNQSACRAYGPGCEEICARVCPRKIIAPLRNG
ncbi:MAG: 4Fe-4S binding protein [Candidatus Adiutrix sp.]|jgi:ferredoxin|nr:4Fe-4S binding protein [Candidatus Adiutrix sp.]